MSRIPEPPNEITPVASLLLGHAQELGLRMARRIRAEVGYYGSEDRVPFAELSTSCRRNAELVFGQLAAGRTDMAGAEDTGRTRARQGAPLGELLHAYRVGSGFLWSELTTAVRGSDAVTADTIASLAAWWVREGLAAAASDAYREAAAALLLQRERERSALVEALFTGALGSRTTLWETADALGLPTEGPYLVVVAEAPGPGREPLPGIEPRLLAERLRSAWRLQPDLQVGVVAAREPDGADTVLRVLERCPGARVGVSPPYRTLRDTPRALRLARLALAGLRERTAGVARFADSPVALLVAASPDEAARAARAVLGPVLELPPAERSRLLETLDRWYAAGGSTAEAAVLLYCHRNTVRYRLRRLEELTGRSLQDPRAVADLAVALQALRLPPPERS
ncbi:helix-turn-helix domain-containing protein [Streptomyces sp. LX-29]|uniref:PucR family transcriptional regulator n=1 Tax=Streptomyces sp. LX-29 TaxID=2900152 RepID=UPI00240CE95F|nr:helix-turn-helix domain-containing protein [Streptomyces sp. LX-29]WFB10655.1 helix-turn-helix domain-containing protein [Streptomyces sp. LX-29]